MQHKLKYIKRTNVMQLGSMSNIAVTNKHTAKLHHVGSFYIYYLHIFLASISVFISSWPSLSEHHTRKWMCSSEQSMFVCCHVFAWRYRQKDNLSLFDYLQSAWLFPWFRTFTLISQGRCIILSGNFNKTWYKLKSVIVSFILILIYVYI